LVSHFRQGLVERPRRRPRAKELQQAELLIREQGEERARAIVTYALHEAPRTGFQMQHFGAVLGYTEAALEALTRPAQQAQQAQEERQRRDAEQQRVQQEQEQQERAAAVLAQLPDAHQAAYRHRAQECLPPFMRDIDGLVERHMRYLVVEDGLV
jgi:predicted metalloprotease